MNRLLWINVFIIFLPPTLMNGMSLKPVAWSGAHTDPVLATMCDKLEKTIQKGCHLSWLNTMKQVIMDIPGRCYCQHQLDTLGTMTIPRFRCGEAEVMNLVTALVHLLNAVLPLGVTTVCWLQMDFQAVGCVLPFRKDTIFVKAANVLHPLEVVATTIHELAHHMVQRCGHNHEIGESHCKAWDDATRYLTVLLWVSRIWMLLLHFPLIWYVYIYIYVCV